MITEWLLGEARRIDSTQSLIAELGKRLNDAGIPVKRLTTGVPILHPHVRSFNVIWNRGSPPVERQHGYDPAAARQLQDSPVVFVYDGGGAVRCRLEGAPRPGEYPILADLRREGLTDYLVIPAPFSDGSQKVVTFATDHPGGFRDSDFAAIESFAPALAIVLETQALKRTARVLLETYVGKETGGRVLEGTIRRGMRETIRAAIWLSDLRDFTALSERLPGDELIALLNAYFGVLGEAVNGSGGEILKFIGDAMLAIFPVVDGEVAAACRAALAAAEEAQTAAAALGPPSFAFGVALHLGNVIYGNIGTEARLDFTVIGPAVNLASRIGGACAELGRTVLASEDFARALNGDLVEVGTFALKGVARPQAVFGRGAGTGKL